MTRATIDNEIVRIMIEDGPDGHCDGHEVITDYVMALVEPLVALLREARRSHDKGYNEESCDYPPCPKSDECEANDNMACTCSADAWNARIDAVLAGR